MYYSIDGLCPSGQTLSGYGFLVKLFPGFKEMVAAYDLDQDGVNRVIDRYGQTWLDVCGYDSVYDPDNYGINKDASAAPGPNARPLHEPNYALRVSWGEWGPEHITVPGNACGLDISKGIHAPRNGRILVPHNVDGWPQVQLLLITFCWFAEALSLNWEIEGDKKAAETAGEGKR